ncbi:MAG: response regulator [Salinivirgaceae bacterium]
MNQFKVLLVDDDINNLELLNAIFENHCPQIDILQTNNPKNAMNIVVKLKPDLVITDWDMPQLNGLELIAELKKNKETRDIPVIMATGVHKSSDDLQVALASGAVDFIKKPFDAQELIARTNSALLISKYHKELLASKDAELTESSLYLVKNNIFNQEMVKLLNGCIEQVSASDTNARNMIKEVINKLNQHTQEDSWFRFNLSFDRVHPEFNKHLIEHFPDLTPTELKLCAFIRLGMSNKEIASLLNQNPDSVKVSRSRLRKKLGIVQSQNLENFLAGF